MEKDLYKILQVSDQASDEVINAAFKALAEKNHPSSPTGNSSVYGEVIAAYEVLGNPTKRRDYDITKNSMFSQPISTFTDTTETNASFENNLSDINADFSDKQNINHNNYFEKIDMQGILSILYEQINFESLNHNPTKARIYQEIYDAINAKRSEIESESPETSSLWQIIQAYKSYLTAHDFRSLKLMIAKRMKVSEQEADLALNSTSVNNFISKKLYIAIGGVFLVFIILVIFISWILGSPKKSELSNNNLTVNTENTAKNNISNAATNDIPTKDNVQQHENINYEANVVDLGSPINLRSAPTTKWDNVVTKLSPAQKVEIVKSEANGWYYIKTDEKEGYIYAGLLSNVNMPGAFPIAETIPNSIKVLDKDHKVYRILKAKDRLVIAYSDSLNYYLKSEKGNLIGISKNDVSLDNKQNSQIPYIDDSTKAGVEFFAVTTEEKVVTENKKPVETDTDTKTPSQQTTTQSNIKKEVTTSSQTTTKPVTIQQNKPVTKVVKQSTSHTIKKDQATTENFVPPVFFPSKPSTGNSNN